MNQLSKNFDFNKIQRNENFCVKYYNSFFHEGPHGSHICIVYEYLGITL